MLASLADGSRALGALLNCDDGDSTWSGHITWPDGREQTIEALAANDSYEILPGEHATVSSAR